MTGSARPLKTLPPRQHGGAHDSERHVRRAMRPIPQWDPFAARPGLPYSATAINHGDAFQRP